MTSSNVQRLIFDDQVMQAWAQQSVRHTNWPVVYTLNNDDDVYVGETRNAGARLKQHLQNSEKRELEYAQVIVDETFHKSACLDLESYLIRLFAGDGKYRVLNRNEGITNAAYFARETYQSSFDAVFEELKNRGYFTRTVPEIVNSDLFKFSPFKALTHDQGVAVADILRGLLADRTSGARSTGVVQGNPGTGKTVLAIYLIKLISDLSNFADEEDIDPDTLFAEFFTTENAAALADFRVALVVPQSSLRKTLQAVFQRVPGLDPATVLSPLDIGSRGNHYDLILVDEAHRLNRRAAQAMGTQTKQFAEINEALFGVGNVTRTQIDWIVQLGTHKLFLVDPDQAVRPADVSREDLLALIDTASAMQRYYRLATQMRIRADSDYIGFVKELLTGVIPQPQEFGDYDLRFFDDFDDMYREISARETEHGLSRLVAGYAWKWNSRKDNTSSDINLGQHRLQWNSTIVDWVNSKKSVHEVGSIHTIQGYDLNYAGVIIGSDLRFDPQRECTFFERKNYYDARGKANNNMLQLKFTDEDILDYVRNIYAVLLTRGILGTYVYVVDEQLRERFRRAFSQLSD